MDNPYRLSGPSNRRLDSGQSLFLFGQRLQVFHLHHEAGPLQVGLGAKLDVLNRVFPNLESHFSHRFRSFPMDQLVFIPKRLLPDGSDQQSAFSHQQKMNQNNSSWGRVRPFFCRHWRVPRGL
jgi:hypothetical protein